MPHRFSAPHSQEFYLVPVAFAAVAVVLAMGPLRFRSPVAPPVEVPAWATDKSPAREISLSPSYTIGAFTYECSECHRVDPPHTAGVELTKHSEISLAHGINSRCLNCHHPVNREAFVDHFGEEIPWDQPQLLCSKCHGPVYRDWQHGSHGRINGYWDKERGELVRLKCIHCHDPHHPPFRPIASAPAPNTLRLKPQSEAAHSNVHNPLRLNGSTHTSDH